ncbi:response regulator [Planctomycetota bacterium]
MVLIVDFESVISEILGVESISIPANSKKQGPKCKDGRILLVDDSAIIRKTLVRILSRYGFENITPCTNGLHAWDTITERMGHDDRPFDLVLSDIEMPQMDGLHLTSKIKSDPQLKDIPVILFSSLITNSNLKKGEAVGADAQISKPGKETMIKTIEAYLSKNQDLIAACN